jgi:uncharacterized membrane protein YccC
MSSTPPLAELAAARTDMQENVLTGLPAEGAEPASEFITSLHPAFRAEEMSYAVSLIARTVGLTAAAERRNWRDRWLGRQPAGVPGTLSAARERITSYLEPHSVWLHNSLRGAAGLGLAVLVARLTGVQHSFWVVLGALSVLRSNALNTGQDAVRAVLGTVAGFIAGAALLVGIGTNTTVHGCCCRWPSCWPGSLRRSSRSPEGRRRGRCTSGDPEHG